MLALIGIAVLGGGPGVEAQQQATLSLPEAISLARRNNPDYLATENDVRVADWAVRDAWGNLLPGADASTTVSYTGAGEQRFGIFTGEDLGLGGARTTDYYTSSYRLGLNYSLNGASLLGPSRERSNRRATVAGVQAAAFNLESNVTRQYLAVLRQQDNVLVSEQELQRARENLRLAEARVSVQAAIPMEAKQAQVEVGRAEVGLLQARNAVYTERLRLMQMLGIDLDAEVQLTSRFEITELPWAREELMRTALDGHPQLRSARASVRAADMNVKMARTAYLPSLSMSAGWSGFARQAGNESYLIDQALSSVQSQQQSCTLLNQISAGLSTPLPNTPVDCSTIVLTPQDEARILESNDVFPFNYTREPFGMSLTLSLPLFNGFQRERQLENARVAERDAELRVRAEELRLRTEVATAHASLETARQSVALEERNRELAQEQLELARERYRVGVTNFIELQDAETTLARAERALLAAMYNFHEALAALEAAVGRPLRQDTETR
ncbi:MAG TPA: TolC family protein [Longimicrobiales bacterium]|nr:TolC family protein [Longimicrobiales bacterium]